MAKRMRLTDLPDDAEEWLKRCVECKHCYVRIKDIDEVYCSLKGDCRFEPIKEKQNESTNTI